MTVLPFEIRIDTSVAAAHELNSKKATATLGKSNVNLIAVTGNYRRDRGTIKASVDAAPPLCLWGSVATVQGGEEDDIKALRSYRTALRKLGLQRDTQTFDRILAGDYTFAGTGDVLIDKEQWVAGVDYAEIRTTSAMADDLRIRVYGDAAVVTGRAVYRGRSENRGVRSPLQIHRDQNQFVWTS